MRGPWGLSEEDVAREANDQTYARWRRSGMGTQRLRRALHWPGPYLRASWFHVRDLYKTNADLYPRKGSFLVKQRIHLVGDNMASVKGEGASSGSGGLSCIGGWRVIKRSGLKFPTACLQGPYECFLSCTARSTQVNTLWSLYRRQGFSSEPNM